MKAITLLLLRLSTGLYLVLWGIIKFTETANAVSNKYYGGMLSGDTLNFVLGSVQIAVGLAVMLGLFRNISYAAQLAWYLAGILPIMHYIIDPFGLYVAESAKLTFFPSTTLLISSLVMIIFKEYDTLTIDSKIKSHKAIS